MAGLNQFGGEGVKSYSGNKNDSNLSQLGGEGHSLSGASSLEFTPHSKPDPKYCGPGRYLKTESMK